MDNPFAGPFGGLRMIATDLMVIGPFEDWSQVRSPGRARRRRAKHKQRIRFYHKPDPNVMHDRVNGVIYGHPATLDHLCRTLEARPACPPLLPLPP